MTIETRTTIEPSDISAIEFECMTCHVKTMFPLIKFKNAPISCSSCDEGDRKQWFIPGSTDFSHMRALGETLQLFSGVGKPEAFVMRFHLTNASASREEI
jgi:hypothetical protein